MVSRSAYAERYSQEGEGEEGGRRCHLELVLRVHRVRPCCYKVAAVVALAAVCVLHRDIVKAAVMTDAADVGSKCTRFVLEGTPLKERRRSGRSTRGGGKSLSYADPSSDFSEEEGEDEDEDEGRGEESSAEEHSEDDFEVKEA